MAVFITKREGMRYTKSEMLRGIPRNKSGIRRKRKLILSSEDEGEDDFAGSQLKGEGISVEERKLHGDKGMSRDGPPKLLGSVSNKRRAVENKSPAFHREEMEERKGKPKLLPKQTRSIHGNAVIQIPDEDGDCSPGSTLLIKSGISRHRKPVDVEVSSENRNLVNSCNASDKNTSPYNKCQPNEGGYDEGDKLREHKDNMKLSANRRTIEMAQAVDNSCRKRLTGKRELEKTCNTAKKEKNPLTTLSLHRGEDRSDEDWSDCKVKHRSPNISFKVQKMQEFEKSNSRRMSERRRITPNKKYSFESNFFVGDWVDDEEDLVFTSDEENGSSDSNNSRKSGRRKQDLEKIKRNLEDTRIKNNDFSTLFLSNSSSSSSSSSLTSASRSDRKSIGRSTNRNKKVTKEEFLKCHQCRRNDVKVVVPCKRCKKTSYCVHCIKE